MTTKDTKRLSSLLKEFSCLAQRREDSTLEVYMFQMIVEELLFIRKEIDNINSSLSNG